MKITFTGITKAEAIESEYLDNLWGITMDSFGDTCPSNWEEIASALNALIREHADSIIRVDMYGISDYSDDDMREFVDNLWETYCSDGIDGVPAPIFEEA